MEKALVWGRNRQRRRFVCAETLHSIENSPHLLVSPPCIILPFSSSTMELRRQTEGGKGEKSFPFLRATPNNLKLVFETLFRPHLYFGGKLSSLKDFNLEKRIFFFLIFSSRLQMALIASNLSGSAWLSLIAKRLQVRRIEKKRLRHPISTNEIFFSKFLSFICRRWQWAELAFQHEGSLWILNGVIFIWPKSFVP